MLEFATQAGFLDSILLPTGPFPGHEPVDGSNIVTRDTGQGKGVIGPLKPPLFKSIDQTIDRPDRSQPSPFFPDTSFEQLSTVAAINNRAEQLETASVEVLLKSRKSTNDIMVGRDGPSLSNNTGGRGERNHKQGRRSPKPQSESRGGLAQGLRGFAMSVCNKIEAKVQTTYNEVADELVEQLRDDPEAGGETKNSDQEPS